MRLSDIPPFARFFVSHTFRALREPVLFRRYFLGWWSALRFFSLIIAANSTVLGILLAWQDGGVDLLRGGATLAAGLLVQAGVNLINDFFEFRQRNLGDKIPGLQLFGDQRNFLEWVVFLTGLACFGLSAALGLVLSFYSGWPLLVLGAIGLAGGYFYTGEPVCYKRRGLGVPLVFVLMGPLMVEGAYYSVTGSFSAAALWISLPLSALVAHILLCNEIRDYEYDIEHGLKTLSYRVGLKPAIVLSWVLLAVGYLGPVVLHFAGLLPHLWLVFLSLPFAIRPMRTQRRSRNERAGIIPTIMLHHLAYGVVFLVTLVWSPFAGSLA